ncbi:MAG: histidine phosphatase family protein [Pseudomonadales bacterium]|nr:histidine phosphatase family protein [Pseudomonadales bacterium]
MLRTLFLVRHGQTVWNVEGRMQGRLDSALTAQGTEQADAHGRLLGAVGGIDALFVSSAGRTRATAALINAHVKTRVHYEDALLERDIGDWSGLTMSEIARKDPQAWQARISEPYHFRPPGGENLADMSRRCAALVDRLLTGSDRRVVVVTHQVMSRVIAGRLLGLTEAETVTTLHPNDLLYRFDFTPGGVVVNHYVAGDGPRAGLLHQTYSETIDRLRAADTLRVRDPSTGGT